MSEIEFMGYKCMFHVRPDDKIHREHNARDPDLIRFEKHIDTTHYHETTLDLGSLDEAYKKIFSKSVEKFNQDKRKDRQISNYLETIRNDKRRGKHRNQKVDGSRKPAYEGILQIGNADTQPDHKQSLKILKLFIEKWIPKKYPCICPIQISYHDDEFHIDDQTGERIYSPVHCHFDFIYLAHCLTPEERDAEKKHRLELKRKMIQECVSKGKKFDEKSWQKKDWQTDLVKRYGKSLTTGLQLQTSMSGALIEMGFKTSRGKGTAQQQFEEQLRFDLQNFAEDMGLKIDRTPGLKHSHDEKNVFQLKKDTERKQKFLDERENKIKQTEIAINDQANVINANYEEMKNYQDVYLERKKSISEKEQFLNIKSRELIKRTDELSIVAQQQQKKQQDLQEQELLVAVEKSTNRMKTSNLKNRTEDLNKREKELTTKEAPLKAREKAVRVKEGEQSERDELLAVRERRIDLKEKNYEEQRNILKSYNDICSEVQANNLNVENAETIFNEAKNYMSVEDRFRSFANTCKKIITATIVQLNQYKEAFKNFWKSTANDFRNLADRMEKNNCSSFKAFHEKQMEGTLEEQIEQRKKEKQQKMRRRQHIEEDMEFDI